MPRYKVEAIVLKAINYRDSDKIYTLFTKNRGKITASAKGVRKITSRRGGNLDTLNHIIAGIVEGNGKNYKIITEVKTLNSFRGIKSSLENSAKGFYIMELINEMLEEGQEANAIFDLLVKSLGKIDTHLNNEISRVNAFEIALLKHAGYEIFLDRCSKTGRPYDDSWEVIRFNPNLGGFVSDFSTSGYDLDKPTADLLYSLKAKNRIPKELLENKKAVQEADKIIKLFIRDILERELRTSRVFDMMLAN